MLSIKQLRFYVFLGYAEKLFLTFIESMMLPLHSAIKSSFGINLRRGLQPIETAHQIFGSRRRQYLLNLHIRMAIFDSWASLTQFNYFSICFRACIKNKYSLGNSFLWVALAASGKGLCFHHQHQVDNTPK